MQPALVSFSAIPAAGVLNKQLYDDCFDVTVRVDETKRDVVSGFDAVPHPA